MTESVPRQPSQTVQDRSTNEQKQTPNGITNMKSSKTHKPKHKATAKEVQSSPRTRHNSKILQTEEVNSNGKTLKDKIKETVVKMKGTETLKSIAGKDKKTEEIASSEVSNNPGGRRSSRKRKINPNVEAFLKGRTLQFETEENEQQEIVDEVTPDVENETTEVRSPKRLKSKSKHQSDPGPELEEVPKTPKRPKGEPVKIVSETAYRKSSGNDGQIDATTVLAKVADSVSKVTNDQQLTESDDVDKNKNVELLHSFHTSQQHDESNSTSKHEESQSTALNDTDEKSEEGVQRVKFPTLRDKKAALSQDNTNETSDTNEENTDSNVKSETEITVSKEKIHDKGGEIQVPGIEEIINSEPYACSGKLQSDSSSDADNPKFNVVFDEESGHYQLTMSIDSKPSAKVQVEKATEKVVQESEVGDLSEADEKLRDDSRAVHTCPVCRKQFLALPKFNKHIVGTNCTNVMLQGVVAAPEDIRPLIEKAGKITDSNQCPNCEKRLYCIEVSLTQL